MHLDRLQRGEYIAISGGIILLVGLFLPWYHLANGNATLAGTTGPASISGWGASSWLRWVLVVAAIAPLILGWIIIREHKLSWPRGQVTSVLAVAAIGLIFYRGVIGRPGDPRSLVGLRWGWIVAIAGAILMLVGSTLRQQETELKRKPPGTL